jgi:hypothetical protein
MPPGPPRDDDEAMGIDPVEITGIVTGMGSAFVYALAVMAALAMAVVFSGVLTSARAQAKMWTPAVDRIDTGLAQVAPSPQTADAAPDEHPSSPLRAAIESTRKAAEAPADEAPEADAQADGHEAESDMHGEWLAQMRPAGGEWKTIAVGATRPEAARQAAKAYAKSQSRRGGATLEVRVRRG